MSQPTIDERLEAIKANVESLTRDIQAMKIPTRQLNARERRAGEVLLTRHRLVSGGVKNDGDGESKQ